MAFSLPSTLVRGLPADGPTRALGWTPSASDRASRAVLGAATVLPPAVLGLAALPPRVSEGQRLDPVFQIGDRFVPLFGDRPLSDEVIDYSRRRTVLSAYHSSGRQIPLPFVEDISLPVTSDDGASEAMIGARLYRPIAEADRELPLLVYIHGGGFAVGTLDSHDAACRYLARRGELAVLSVDYRLAPENRYPIPLDDVVCALRWAREHAAELGVDATRIAVGGDSAGGNLSTTACLRLRDAGEELPAFQFLAVPVTTVHDPGTTSFRTYAEGPYLTEQHIDYFTSAYLGGQDLADNPYVSPLLAEDLSGLPPAHVAVAGFDPLRDQGEAYGRAMRAAGVPVSIRRHPSLVHPFMNSVGVSAAARSAADQAIGAMRMALAY